MYKMTFTLLAMTFSFMAVASGMEATCKLCEKIRERNKQNPSSGYTYYEDYLKAEEKGGNKQAGNEKAANPQNPQQNENSK